MISLKIPKKVGSPILPCADCHVPMEHFWVTLY